VFARRLTTVLLTLQAEENVNIKIYLPKRYAEEFDEQDIEDINTGTKTYTLINKGRSGSACHTYGFVKEDVAKHTPYI